MGKTDDDKRIGSNEFKQLLLPEDKRNYILCSSTSSSIKDSSNSSISASPASTTSHLSEYSSSDKPAEERSITNREQKTATNSDFSQKINIKENKLNKENYVLLLNDLDHLKSVHLKNVHSSPSTKSSSINSLNQLIKSSPMNSANLPRQINRSLTFIDQNGLENSISKYNKPTSSNQQYFKQSDDRHRLSKSTQCQTSTTYEHNLPQSYSAVFNDRYSADRQFNDTANGSNLFRNQFTNQYNDAQLKISFKDSFYRKWGFLNKFHNRTDHELNFDQNAKTKRPKLINLKRYSSIDLNREDLIERTNEQSTNRQSNYAEKATDETAGPSSSSSSSSSGLQVKTNRSNDKTSYLKSDLKIQQITNPLHPFYLNAVNCSDIDTWTVSDSNDHAIDDSTEHRNAQLNANYSTLVCSTNEPKKSNDKLNKRSNQSPESNQSNRIGNKKPILLPKLHNEYCTNTNSSHHHHHKNHMNENSSNCSNSSTTTRSSSTNSSNVSTSSSTDDNKANNTLKSVNNELSGSLSSVSSDVNPMLPICKICHLNGKDEDPLITPCKCSGTMQFIHCRCLMRWLEISKKKSRKPLSCELCQYQYQWHKKFKVGSWQFPKCTKRDKFLHLAFIISVIIMICCSLSIIIFFKLQEPVYRIDPRRYDLSINEPATVGFAMVFVFSFLMSLYAQVKAKTTLYRLIMNFIYLNQQWYINEYEKNNSVVKEIPGTPEIV